MLDCAWALSVPVGGAEARRSSEERRTYATQASAELNPASPSGAAFAGQSMRVRLRRDATETRGAAEDAARGAENALLRCV